MADTIDVPQYISNDSTSSRYNATPVVSSGQMDVGNILKIAGNQSGGDGPSVADIIEKTGKQDELLAHAQNQIQANNANMQKVLNQKAINIESQVPIDTANGTTLEQESAGKLQALLGTTKFATSAGINLSDPAEILTSLAEHQRTADNNALALAEEQRARFESAGNNPFAQKFAALKNLKTANLLQANMNISDMIGKRIEKLNQETQVVSTTQKDIAPIITNDSRKQMLDTAQKLIEDKALEIKAQALQLGTEGVKAVTEMSQQQLQNTKSEFELGESMQMRQLREQMIQENIGRIQENLKNKEETDRYNQFVSKAITVGLGNLGNTDLLKRVDMPNLIKLAKDDPDIKNAFISGMNTLINGQSTLSSSPAMSAEMLQGTSGKQIPPARKAFIQMLTQGLSSAQEGKSVDPVTGASVAITGFDAKNKEMISSTADKNIQAIDQFKRNQIDPAGNDNPYNAPNLQSVTTNKGLQNSPFYQIVLKPMVTQGMTVTDPAKIMQLAAQSVADGNLKFRDAVAGIQMTFLAAINMNNAQNMPEQVGLLPQSKYPAKIPFPNNPLRHASVDMTDYLSISNELSNQVFSRNITANRGQK